MKKALLVLATVLSVAVCAKANPVDVNKAKTVATSFLRSVGNASGFNSELTDITGQTTFHEFYVFSFQNGFVIVSGDDCVTPILGYSTHNGFMADKMPAHIADWLMSYEEQIAYYKSLYSSASSDSRQNMPTVRDAKSSANIMRQWECLTGNGGTMPPMNDAVSPLLSTTWAQDPYYNNNCPYDNSYSSRAVAGCVATATAQIMKYWNHPTTGYGSHSYYHDNYGTLSANFANTTYAWSSMPNSLSASSTTAQVNAVATLIFHIGVAVEMNYSTVSSGASTTSDGTASCPSAENALKNYFKYSPLLHTVSRENFSDADWCELLMDELDNNRPILYSGHDTSGGHAFVLDGYNNAGLFHINWGWGGWCDGYYTMGNLNPASGGTGGNSSYTFNLSNHAVVGIQPNNSFGGSTTVSVSSNNASYGTVSGGGTYSLGDTVYINASASSGYRLSQWSDGYQSAYREFVATGGSVSLTAQFEQLTGDTLGYCGNAYVSSLGGSNGSTWGIKLPASVLTNGHDLKKVQLYVAQAGTYNLTVYTGTSSASTTAATMTFNAQSSNAGQWNTITLTSPVTVDATKSIWISFSCSDVSYPATMTYNSGNSDAMLWGSSLYSIASSWNYSWMIRGIFEGSGSGGGETTMNDTISYCGNNAYSSSIGVNSTTTTIYWGIRIPSSQLAGRNSISNVLLYVPSSYGGTYTMNIYEGGSTAPQTLLHTQSYSFTTNLDNWQVCIPSSPIAINTSQDLWVTFSNTGVTYPAAGCSYVSDPNSDWISLDGTSWGHCYSDYSLDYSWMIKCITSSGTAAPAIHIDGPSQVIAGESATYTANATSGATITWSLEGATPSTASGSSVTASWTATGSHNVIATATTSNGSSSDTLSVSVVGCNPITSYPYTMDFEDSDNLTCWHFIDSDGDGYGWTLQSKSNSGQRSIGSASYINNIGALTPDNWMIMPEMQFLAGHNYELSWYTGVLDVNYYAEQYGIYVSTSGINPSDFSLVQQYTIADTGWTQHSLDLSSYAGQNIHIAIRHYGTTDIYWMLVDDIQVTETQPETYNVSFSCTGNGDGSITAQEIDNTSLCGLTYDVQQGDSLTLTISRNYCSWLQNFYLNNVDILESLGYAAYDSDIRTFTLKPTSATSIHAVFTKYTYTVTAAAEPSYMGTVEGTGQVNCGSTVTLTAVPSNSNYRFVRWMDNNTSNPRTIQVSDNLHFIAYFESIEGIDDSPQTSLSATIYPNPSNGTVTIQAASQTSVKVFDINGRLCFSDTIGNGSCMLSGLSSGVYIVQFTTDQNIETTKLIVK